LLPPALYHYEFVCHFFGRGDHADKVKSKKQKTDGSGYFFAKKLVSIMTMADNYN
jgi:hypothetical protein